MEPTRFKPLCCMLVLLALTSGLEVLDNADHLYIADHVVSARIKINIGVPRATCMPIEGEIISVLNRLYERHNMTPGIGCIKSSDQPTKLRCIAEKLETNDERTSHRSKRSTGGLATAAVTIISNLASMFGNWWNGKSVERSHKEMIEISTLQAIKINKDYQHVLAKIGDLYNRMDVASQGELMRWSAYSNYTCTMNSRIIRSIWYNEVNSLFSSAARTWRTRKLDEGFLSPNELANSLIKQKDIPSRNTNWLQSYASASVEYLVINWDSLSITVGVQVPWIIGDSYPTFQLLSLPESKSVVQCMNYECTVVNIPSETFYTFSSEQLHTIDIHFCWSRVPLVCKLSSLNKVSQVISTIDCERRVPSSCADYLHVSKSGVWVNTLHEVSIKYERNMYFTKYNRIGTRQDGIQSNWEMVSTAGIDAIRVSNETFILQREETTIDNVIYSASVIDIIDGADPMLIPIVIQSPPVRDNWISSPEILKVRYLPLSLVVVSYTMFIIYSCHLGFIAYTNRVAIKKWIVRTLGSKLPENKITNYLCNVATYRASLRVKAYEIEQQSGHQLIECPTAPENCYKDISHQFQ